MKPINTEKKQIDLIKESICVYTKCMECRALFRDNKLCFASIEDFVDDKGRSCLFRLKEMCHGLYRNSNDATYKEKLYDVTVGYIFHEAMKLRENLYQLEYYAPGRDIPTHELTSVERKIVREIDVLVKKAEKRLKEGFKEIRILLKELVEQLKDLIRLYKDNYLLSRFIFENEKALIKIYGKKGFHMLLHDMYGNGKTTLLFRAAVSYLESEHYGIARLLFQRVSNLDRENMAALFLHMYSAAFHFYFKNMYTKSLSIAEKALSMDISIDRVDFYRNSLKKLTADLYKETKRKTKEREEVKNANI